MPCLFSPEGTATEDDTEPLEVETTEVSTGLNVVIHNLMFAGLEETLSIEIYFLLLDPLFVLSFFSVWSSVVVCKQTVHSRNGLQRNRTGPSGRLGSGGPGNARRTFCEHMLVPYLSHMVCSVVLTVRLLCLRQMVNSLQHQPLAQLTPEPPASVDQDITCPPADPVVRKQVVQDLMAQMQGTFNFMQVRIACVQRETITLSRLKGLAVTLFYQFRKVQKPFG